MTFLEFFEGLIGCAIKYNSNLSALSSATSFKNKTIQSANQQNEPTTAGQELTTASRPSSKSQYVKSESKSTDYFPQTENKTETNGKIKKKQIFLFAHFI